MFVCVKHLYETTREKVSFQMFITPSATSEIMYHVLDDFI